MAMKPSSLSTEAMKIAFAAKRESYTEDFINRWFDERDHRNSLTMPDASPEDHAEPSRTDDPKAEYGEQPKREPLLSDKAIDGHDLARDLARIDPENATALRVGMRLGRKFYENEITEGRLTVVKPVTLDAQGDCIGCGRYAIDYWSAEPFTCCPGCGQPIKP